MTSKKKIIEEKTIEQKIGKGIDGAVTKAREVGDKAKDLAQRATHTVKEAAKKVGEKMGEAGQRIKDGANRA